MLDQIEDSASKPSLKLLELNLIAHFTFNALQVPLQLREIRRLRPAIGRCLIPIADLKTEKHANHDDDKIDPDRCPFLLAQVRVDAAQNHGVGISSCA